VDSYFGDFRLIFLIFRRSLAGLYCVAFLSAFAQFPALLGEKGLLPVPEFLRRSSFRQSPSIFHLAYSDTIFTIVASLGIVVSVTALLGVSERGPFWVSMAVWLVLWVLYLSIVNVGQTFYSFGWESMLLEAGFIAAFLGNFRMEPPVIPLLVLRWMLFRTELGAGLIKLRHDVCWRDLTCLYYHHETQPMPNPLSRHFHHLPKLVHRTGVVFSHLVQLVAPFGLFAPQPIAAVSGALILVHQLMLIVSGNYAWLNWLTAILGLAAFSDALLAPIVPLDLPPALPRSPAYEGMLYGFAVLTLILSVQPAMNFFSRNQLMNYSYNRLHLINAYGAFGSVTRTRYEIVIEGTDDPVLLPQARWKEYEFKGKPGGGMWRPPQVAPYHLRLDWLMWFLPLAVRVSDSGIVFSGHTLWFLRLVKALLEGDRKTLRLLRRNPFPDAPPRLVRARFYRYRFTSRREKRDTGEWWVRTLIDDYLPPVGLADLRHM
jgi:hypothetical protein